jgi:hypothetical protein
MVDKIQVDFESKKAKKITTVFFMMGGCAG